MNVPELLNALLLYEYHQYFTKLTFFFNTNSSYIGHKCVLIIQSVNNPNKSNQDYTKCIYNYIKT